MTLQDSPIDLNALLAAANMVAFQFGALGEVDVRELGPQERSGRFDGGVALSVRTGGAGPGQVGLVAGADAAATVLGEGDVLERWEPLMAAIVVALTEQAGDLEPQDVQVLAPGAGNGPALDPEAISIGLFLEDQLLGAIGFVAEQGAGAKEPSTPRSTSADEIGLVTERAAVAAPAAPVFHALVGQDTAAVEVRRMNLLRDVEMGVSVELGRTRMTVRDLLALAPGAIVELDKAAGAPVDLLVNGTLMARGEVVVIDEEFAVRISEIVTPELDDRHGTSDRRGA
jgi:flagellar motor switch protein FliN